MTYNSVYWARYYLEHREEIAKQRAAHYQEHRDEIRQRQAEHRRKHRQKILQRQRAYYQRHRERELANAAVYRQTPAGKAATARAGAKYLQTPNGKAAAARGDAKRRVVLATSDATLTGGEWESIQERNKHRCFYCKKKRKLTMDHVIPLSKGGKHIKENIVPACKPCNSKKSNKILFLV